MGMFDYVKCEAPLPNGAVHPDDNFQTKDLDRQLDTYVITKDGRLVRHEAPREGGSGDPMDGKGKVELRTIALDFYGDDCVPLVAFFQNGVLVGLADSSLNDGCAHPDRLALNYRKTWVMTGPQGQEGERVDRRVFNWYCAKCGQHLKDTFAPD
jgi:hypothetical protein